MDCTEHPDKQTELTFNKGCPLEMSWDVISTKTHPRGGTNHLRPYLSNARFVSWLSRIVVTGERGRTGI